MKHKRLSKAKAKGIVKRTLSMWLAKAMCAVDDPFRTMYTQAVSPDLDDLEQHLDQLDDALIEFADELGECRS